MPSKKSTPRPARTTGAVKSGQARSTTVSDRAASAADPTEVRRDRAQKYLREERLRQAELEAQGYCF